MSALRCLPPPPTIAPMDAIDRMQEAEAAMHARAISAARPRTRTRSGSGVCVECGDPISPARLAALPDARTCIGCQRELEEGD